MKAIKTNIVINSIRSRKDRSISFSCETPELDNNERNIFFDLQGLNCNVLIEPKDEAVEDTVTVDKDIQTKTQSQRIRAIIYLIWKQNGEKGEFKDYYHNQTERLITKLKTLLD